MIGESQVVIGAEVERMLRTAIAFDLYLRLLGPGYQSFGLVETLRFEGLGLCGERLKKTGCHGNTPLYSTAAKYSKMRFRDLSELMVLLHAF